MATKRSKGKMAKAKKEAKPKEKQGSADNAIYKVCKPIWLRGTLRQPGYVLQPEDIGYLEIRGIFDHVFNKLKAIKEA